MGSILFDFLKTLLFLQFQLNIQRDAGYNLALRIFIVGLPFDSMYSTVQYSHLTWFPPHVHNSPYQLNTRGGDQQVTFTQQGWYRLGGGGEGGGGCLPASRHPPPFLAEAGCSTQVYFV